jgi:hypothetical protein
MVDRTVEHEETLGEFLASRARRASDTLLAGHAIIAVVTAVAIAAWRGPLWDVRLSLATCFLAFGVWGIADRDISAKQLGSRRVIVLLRAVRFTAAVCGFAAAAFLAMALLGRALGRIIS